ncbi:HupE/UreJ family protein [Fredinandcohnia sp. 179-A 10B2 NHS]|uniref:HupE/UreJ family protein n=1 Tax=Fredinandcohnia sp. 179-A 10B2 NHS TaxID=3235176 RepID=UPI00399F522D
MKKITITLVVILLSLIGSTNLVFAHPYSAGYTTLYLVNQNVELVYSIDIESLEELVHDLHEEEAPLKDILDDYKPQIDELIQKNLLVYIDNSTVDMELKEIKLDQIQDTRVVTTIYQLPVIENGQSFKLDDQFYSKTKDTNYVNFLTVKQPEQSTKIALEGENREWLALVDGLEEGTESSIEDLTPVKETSDFWSFFKLGMHHIITGYDHLLFLLALVIRPQRVRDLVAIITAFTVGHSLTIALGTFDIVTLPSRFVEIVIALSICYVAIENIFRKEIKYRWLVTVLFGLIHGLGFSGLLKESLGSKTQIAVELFAFNIGIEVIQLLLAFIVIPLMIFAYKKLDSKKVVIPVSLIVTVMGGFWFLQRLIGF